MIYVKFLAERKADMGSDAFEAHGNTWTLKTICVWGGIDQTCR